ncbi:MAG: lipopolysaccharide biosynthesis protein [Pseudochelatococcus sp.]|uniref:lipopolysaccharide biosynthesis protein n=1 Tax=Pseudochelatococcus sp. TaxID=2020869 RepID=UPI003D8E1443
MKTIAGAGWLVLSRFLGRFIDFIALIVLARILTPADFGLTALAMTLIVIVDMVLEVPIVQALVRLRSFDKSHLDTGFTISLMRGLLVALIVLGAAWPFAQIYGDERLVPLLAVLATAPLARSLISPAMARFARALSFRQLFIVETSGKIVAFVIAVSVVFLGGGYWAIVINTVTSAVMAMIASYLLAPYRPRLSLSRFSDFSHFAGWFSAAQIVSALNWQFDRMLLGRFVDAATFGKYVLASDMSAFPTQSVIGPAMQSVMAAFSNINNDAQRLRQAFLKAARFVMLISAPVCIGISVTADLAIEILLGANWLEASKILQLLAIAVLPVPYFQALYSFSLALNRPAVILQMNAIDFGLRLLLISAGVYFFSIDGVLWARLVIAAAMFIVYLLYARLLSGIGVVTQLVNMWKVALAVLLMAEAALALRGFLAPLGLGALVELAVTAAAGAAVYVCVLLACGVRVMRGEGRFALHDRWW